jgi:hypothetical protein
MAPRIPVRATLAGQSIDTTVDSHAAWYYLERFLQGHREEPDLDRAIEQVHAQTEGGMPAREFLRDLSRRFSVDFAAAVLARRLLQDERSRSFRYLFEQELEATRARSVGDPALTLPAAGDYTFLFVPGYAYRTAKESGADLARHRDLLTRSAIGNRLLLIEEAGPIEENAEHIARELSQASTTSKRIIVISASTGGPSTALALASLSASQRRSIKAWVNVGGLIQGTALADRAARLPHRWIIRTLMFFRRWPWASVESMRTVRSRARFVQTPIPDDVFCLNYIGIPFSGDITERARPEYRRLRAEGPNDGLTLITDAIVPHGVTIAVLGADHYQADAGAVLRTAALTRAVLRYLGETEMSPADAGTDPAALGT